MLEIHTLFSPFPFEGNFLEISLLCISRDVFHFSSSEQYIVIEVASATPSIVKARKTGLHERTPGCTCKLQF